MRDDKIHYAVLCFDSSDGFVLFEGEQQMGSVPLMEGKVRYIRLC